MAFQSVLSKVSVFSFFPILSSAYTSKKQACTESSVTISKFKTACLTYRKGIAKRRESNQVLKEGVKKAQAREKQHKFK